MTYLKKFQRVHDELVDELVDDEYDDVYDDVYNNNVISTLKISPRS